METAHEALEELMRFLDEASEDLQREVGRIHGTPADVRSRDYWRSVLRKNIMA
jgi:hypothetical protein